MTTETITTLNIGELELRKTPEGWEYLSEGIHTEPDRWLPASSRLGAFSGEGVNTLLDELLIAREQATAKAENACKNCKYWLRSACDFIDTIQGERVAGTTGCEIVATANDDWGLSVKLKTGPDYSCPNFSPRQAAA